MKIPFHKHSFRCEDSERYELNGGRHTMFMILKCWCGEKQAFPQSNLEIAINSGTLETKLKIKKLGIND